MAVDWNPRSASWRYPRLLLALKTGVATAGAWLLVQPFGGFVDKYPYYAPLGAVVAMSTSVVHSVRTAIQAVAAIITGAALAFGVHALPLPEPVAIGIGIGLGMLCATVRVFGTMAGWVPFATLFVLIVGAGNPWEYAAAYGGLTALGAAVGLVVNLALPQLPLTPAGIALDRLRDQLAHQLDLLADGLESGDVLSPDDWAQLRLELRPQARRVEDLVAAAHEARRANWLAGRWQEDSDRREEQARALQRLTGSIDEVIDMVVDVRTSVHADDEVASLLRKRAAAAFRAVAEMLRTVEMREGGADGRAAPVPESVQAAQAVMALAEDASRAAAESDHHYLAAGAIAATLHRAVEAWS